MRMFTGLTPPRPASVARPPSPVPPMRRATAPPCRLTGRRSARGRGRACSLRRPAVRLSPGDGSLAADPAGAGHGARPRGHPSAEARSGAHVHKHSSVHPRVGCRVPLRAPASSVGRPEIPQPWLVRFPPSTPRAGTVTALSVRGLIGGDVGTGAPFRSSFSSTRSRAVPACHARSNRSVGHLGTGNGCPGFRGAVGTTPRPSVDRRHPVNNSRAAAYARPRRCSGRSADARSSCVSLTASSAGCEPQGRSIPRPRRGHSPDGGNRSSMRQPKYRANLRALSTVMVRYRRRATSLT